jgi:hypothetical protein
MASVVACPSCGEAIRVPHHPHPNESFTLLESPFSPPAIASVQQGLLALLRSLRIFFVALLVCAVLLGLRLFVLNPPHAPDGWAQLGIIVLSMCWGSLALYASWLRYCGYRACKLAGAALGVGGYSGIAAKGALFSALGSTSLVPILIGRPIIELPVVVFSLVLIGLVAGGFGLVLEFTFLPMLHRFLWEHEGQHVAQKTDRYLFTVVLAVLGSLFCTMFGGLLIVTLVQAQSASLPPGTPVNITMQLRLIGLAVVTAVTLVTLWPIFRYANILEQALRSFTRSDRPTPHGAPPLHHRKPN